MPGTVTVVFFAGLAARLMASSLPPTAPLVMLAVPLTVPSVVLNVHDEVTKSAVRLTADRSPVAAARVTLTLATEVEAPVALAESVITPAVSRPGMETLPALTGEVPGKVASSSGPALIATGGQGGVRLVRAGGQGGAGRGGGDAAR